MSEVTEQRDDIQTHGNQASGFEEADVDLIGRVANRRHVVAV
jgi:hypothetical protein